MKDHYGSLKFKPKKPNDFTDISCNSPTLDAGKIDPTSMRISENARDGGSKFLDEIR